MADRRAELGARRSIVTGSKGGETIWDSTRSERIQGVLAIGASTPGGEASAASASAWLSGRTEKSAEGRGRRRARRVGSRSQTGTFDEHGMQPRPDSSALTFRKLTELYKDRHVLAKGLALISTIDYRPKPLIDGFGDRVITEIRTADIEDFVADLRRPRAVNSEAGRTLAPASINRTLGLLRHMLNWAVGREYLDRTPFRRGTEVLIRMEREDNKRRRRISEREETALLAVAPSHLRSMIIAALDTGMRRGEMLALRFGDIDWARQLITLRGPTTKGRRTRVIPIGPARLRAVLERLRLDGGGGKKADHVPVFSNEAGDHDARHLAAARSPSVGRGAQ